MNIIRLTFKKVILALIIFAFLPVFKHIIPIMCSFGRCEPVVEYMSLLGMFKSSDAQFSYFVLLGAISAYISSAILISIWDSIPAEAKSKYFKLSKGKVIISALGCISVFPIILHNLSGRYGGLMNMPASLNTLYGFGELLEVILLPFSMLTNLLYHLTGNLLSLIIFISKIPFRLTDGRGLAPEYLTAYGTHVIVLFIAVEWYLISCLIVYFYIKIKERVKQ